MFWKKPESFSILYFSIQYYFNGALIHDPLSALFMSTLTTVWMKHGQLARWRRWSVCDVGQAKKGSEPHSPTLSLLHLVTAHSSILMLLHLVTAHSSILMLLHLCHSSFYNPSIALTTSQALHLRHLASRPCPYNDIQYIHDDFVICNDCGPQDYMKDVNWPSNTKGWRPLP